MVIPVNKIISQELLHRLKQTEVMKYKVAESLERESQVNSVFEVSIVISLIFLPAKLRVCVESC